MERHNGEIHASLDWLSHFTGTDYRNPYVYGTPPMLPPWQLEQAYGPSVQSLRDTLNYPVVFRTKSSLEEFGDAIAAAEYDILVVHPIIFLELARSANYLPIARRTDELRALIVVNKESSLNRIEDLRKVTIGWLPEFSITTRLTLQHLQNSGLSRNELQSQIFNNYQDCLLALIQGKTDACVTVPLSLKYFSERLNVEFKVISRSPPIPHKLYAVHQSVSASQRQLIKNAVLGWGETNESRAIINSMGVEPVDAVPAFVPITDEDLTAARILDQQMAN